MLYSIPKWVLPLLVLTSISLTNLAGQVFILRDTFCSNQFVIINGHLYGPDNPTGTEILPGAAANGADSIIQVQLSFFQPVTLLLEPAVCAGDTIWVNNVAYHAGFFIGQEIIENGASNGCDSIIQVNLNIVSSVKKIQQVLCDGDTLLVNGAPYSAFRPNGVEIIPNGAANGLCDSVIQVNLTIVPLPYSEILDTLCPDAFLIVNGQRYDRDFRSGLEILPNASALGCDSLVSIRLFFRDSWMSLGDDQEISYGDEVCLEPLFSFTPIQMEWTPTLPCTDISCLPICAQFFADTAFQLTATDPNGCVLQDTIRIVVSRKPPVYAPNVFSPTANWPNNRFFFSAGGGVFDIKRLQIANRWGEIVFDQTGITPDDPAAGWDGQYRGKDAPPGVYIYWAETLLWDGSTEIISGSFALLR